MGRSPTYKHHSLASATDEAKRLASIHPDNAFVVLEAVGGSFGETRTLDVKITKEQEPEDDGIPF